MTDKVLIIDGMNQIWRATFSFGEKKVDETLSPEQLFQREVNVIVYNFFRNTRPLIELFGPEKIFLCLEGHPRHRYALYPEYKANRIIKTASKTQNYDKVMEAASIITRLLQFHPITICKADNYECDDVISYLCSNLKDEDITILSNDTDFIQLLQKGYNCKVYNPISKKFYEAPEYHYVCWKSLCGDSTDNIIGMMGEAKAKKIASSPDLLEKFLSVEENRANFAINKQLIEFAEVPEAEVKVIEGYKQFDKLKQEFRDMEFESLLKEKTWQTYVDTYACVKY